MDLKGSHTFIFLIFVILGFLLLFDVVYKIYMHIATAVFLYIIYKGIIIYTKQTIAVTRQGVFITGCDTGFGHGIALRLARLGYTVFAGCLHVDGDGAKDLITNGGDTLYVVPLDVTKDESVNRALEFVKSHKPETGLWAVINNAAIEFAGGVEFARLETMERVVEVNFFGVLRVTKTFLPLIRESMGRVVNVSSVKGRFAMADDVAYVSAKWACEAFSDVLRREMYRFRVKVIVIEPGQFGAVTSILQGERLRLAEDELNRCWDSASDEVKAAYGRGCIDALVHNLRDDSVGSSTTMTPVLDAMQDAVENVHPKCRYLIGGSNKLVDKTAITAVLNQFLPEPLMDTIYRMYFPLPVVKQQTTK